MGGLHRMVLAMMVAVAVGLLAAPGQAVAAPDASTPVKYYVVGDNTHGQREYLYEIAVKTLGNGNRYHEIFDLNQGRSQPGGGRLTDPLVLSPGWILVLPDDASGPDVHSGPLPGVSRSTSGGRAGTGNRPGRILIVLGLVCLLGVVVAAGVVLKVRQMKDRAVVRAPAGPFDLVAVPAPDLPRREPGTFVFPRQPGTFPDPDPAPAPEWSLAPSAGVQSGQSAADPPDLEPERLLPDDLEWLQTAGHSGSDGGMSDHSGSDGGMSDHSGSDGGMSDHSASDGDMSDRAGSNGGVLEDDVSGGGVPGRGASGGVSADEVSGGGVPGLGGSGGVSGNGVSGGRGSVRRGRSGRVLYRFVPVSAVRDEGLAEGAASDGAVPDRTAPDVDLADGGAPDGGAPADSSAPAEDGVPAGGVPDLGAADPGAPGRGRAGSARRLGDLVAVVQAGGIDIAASLLGTRGDEPGTAYDWRTVGQAPPAGILPLMLGERDGRRLYVDLACCPDVLTLDGTRPESERYALRLARQLLADGNQVAVLGNPLDGELPEGCRQVSSMGELGESDTPGVVICAAMGRGDVRAARQLRAAGGPVPVLIGDVAHARWSVRVGTPVGMTPSKDRLKAALEAVTWSGGARVGA